VKLHSRIFGWKQVWFEFSEEFNAQIDDPNPDSSTSKLTMSMPIDGTDWELLYTMVPGDDKLKSEQHTTVETNIIGTDDFKFALYPESWYHGLHKLLGVQDIVVGHEDFDKAFMIKGSDEAKVKALFDDAVLRKLFLDEPQMQYWVSVEHQESMPTRKSLREGQSKLLSLRVKGAVDDFERLKTFYKLKHRILAQLTRLGVCQATTKS